MHLSGYLPDVLEYSSLVLFDIKYVHMYMHAFFNDVILEEVTFVGLIQDNYMEKLYPFVMINL